MAGYGDIASIKAAIMQFVTSAVQSASVQTKEEIVKQVESYYAGSPVMYQRTYQLKNTPMTTPVSSGADSASFEAYLNPAGGYPSITYTYWDGNQTTSKAPSMMDILNLTNDGATGSSVGYLHPAIGNGGYWQRAESQMQNILDSNLSKYFS